MGPSSRMNPEVRKRIMVIVRRGPSVLWLSTCNMVASHLRFLEMHPCYFCCFQKGKLDGRSWHLPSSFFENNRKSIAHALSRGRAFSMQVDSGSRPSTQLPSRSKLFSASIIIISNTSPPTIVFNYILLSRCIILLLYPQATSFKISTSQPRIS